MNSKNEALRSFDELNNYLKSLDLSQETKQKIKELLDKIESAILLI